MKRVLAVLLMILLLVQALPLEALATVGHVLTREELARAYALTGLGEDSALYHNGMTPNGSWNAMQLSEWLEDTLSGELYNVSDVLSRASYALEELKERNPDAYKLYTTDKSYEMESARKVSLEAEAMRQELRYQQDRLDEDAQIIAELTNLIIQEGDTLFESDKVRYSAKIEAATKDIREARQHVTDNAKAWTAQISDWLGYVQIGPNGNSGEGMWMGDWLSEIFESQGQPVTSTAPVTAVRASNSRLSQLSNAAGLATNDADTNITVISESEICFILVANVNGKKTPVPNVQIKAGDANSKDRTMLSYTTNEKGMAVLPTNKYISDEFKEVHVCLEIEGEPKGYRNYRVDNLDMELGQVVEIPLTPLKTAQSGDPEEGDAANVSADPYIYSASFNGKDILLHDYHMIYSPVNDYKFDIKVEVKHAQESSELVMIYYEENAGIMKNDEAAGTRSNKEIHVQLERRTVKPTSKTNTKDGAIYTFNGPWKKLFSPSVAAKDRPTFQYTAESKVYFSTTSRLVPVRSATDRPINEGTDAFKSVLGKGLSMEFQIPYIQAKINLDLPFTQYLPKINIDPAGYVVICVGSDIFNEDMEKLKANWQSKDEKMFKQAQTMVQREGFFANYKAQYNLAKDYYRTKMWKLMGASTIKFGIFAVASGRWELDNDNNNVMSTPVSLHVATGMTMTYAYSWTISYPVLGVPVYVSFSLGINAAFCMQHELTFCWVNGKFQDWRFRPVRNITIVIGLMLSAQMGVGIKGFLEAWVKLTASLNLLVTLSITNSAPADLLIECDLKFAVGATVFFIRGSKEWTLAKKQLYPPEQSQNLLERYMSNDGGEKVEATYGEPTSYPNLAPQAKAVVENLSGAKGDIKVATVKDHTYVFYLGEAKNARGKTHKRVCWIDVNTGNKGTIQEALDRFQNDNYRYKAHDRDDYAYDVYEADGMVILAVAHASSFDKNGAPTRITKPSAIVPANQSQSLYVIVLEPDSTGKLCHLFPTTRLSTQSNSYADHYIKDTMAWGADDWKYAYDSFTDPKISYVRMVWKDKEKRQLERLEVYGKLSRIQYPDDANAQDAQTLVKNADSAGATFFAFNNGKVLGKLFTDKTVATGTQDGYERQEVVSCMYGQHDFILKDMQGGKCLDFISLNVPKNGKQGKHIIEMFDWDMNRAKKAEGRRGIALAEGDIQHFEVLAQTDPQDANKVYRTVFYTQTETSGDGATQTRLYGLRIQPTNGAGTDDLSFEVTKYSYDLTMPANRFSIGYIGATPYLYWIGTAPKKDEKDDNVWRIWGVPYDPATNTMSKPMVLAEFKLSKAKSPDGKSTVDVVPDELVLTGKNTGYLSTLASFGSETKQLSMSVFSFPEQLRPSANVTTALCADSVVAAGKFEDVTLGIMNDGSLGLASFDVQMVEMTNGKTGNVIETVHIDSVNPEKSKVTMVDGKVVMTGKKVAYRNEDFEHGSGRSNWVLSHETREYKVHMGDAVELKSSATKENANKYFKSNVLLPGTLGGYTAAFRIPENWKGEKKLRMRISEVRIQANWVNAMANAAIADADGLAVNAADQPVELVYKLDEDSGKLVMQTPVQANGKPVEDEAVMNAVRSGLYPNEIDAGSEADFVTNIQDIDVESRMYTGFDGEEWLDIVIQNHAVTNDALKLTCAVYLDGASKADYFSLPYYKQTTSSRKVHTISLPVKALINDVTKHERARVVISAVGREDRVSANNEFMLYLNGENVLQIVTQPEDLIVQEGEDGSFKLEVTGGTPPYSYQWQVWDEKHQKWVDLPGFTDPTLSREDIEKKWDGAKFRCVITDADGTQIISEEVTITVRDKVPTGDSSNLPLYLVVAALALLAMALLTKRFKEERNR